MYGHSIAKNLLSCDVSSKNSEDRDGKGKQKAVDDAVDFGDDIDEPESWKAQVHFTNPNYQAKKFVFLLFINRGFFPFEVVTI